MNRVDYEYVRKGTWMVRKRAEGENCALALIKSMYEAEKTIRELQR
jgi:hypothetical protein